MKYLVVSFIVFFYTLQTFGQQEYFVYLQTDNSQAFYLRINKNVYSSTASGFLIVSKTADSSFDVSIGFPKNIYPEQQFTIPAGHKDAGYVLKNFSEKGWGLFNLQTQAVLMNRNPPEEKKSPEITGNKKTDAFSLLLANAVNDTAVLYTVAKPKKLVPAPPEIAIEQSAKDSAALTKTAAEKKDSSFVTKNATPLLKDDSSVAHLPQKGSVAAGNNRKPINDTSSIAKKAGKTITAPKNAVTKTTVTADNDKRVSKPAKDTIIIGKSPSAPVEAPGLVKNKERKDSIILMSSAPAKDNNTLAKNKAPQKTNAVPALVKKDSLSLAKNKVVQQPAETNSGSTNNPPVVENAIVKKDTVPALVKNDPLKPTTEQPEPIHSIPSKRLRPLVNKAAELYTDSSYVAVFVDESKEQFDTIRISIPLDEYLARVSRQKAPVLQAIETAGGASLITKDSTAAVKKDSGVAGVLAKDTEQHAISQPPVNAVAKKDSAAAGQAVKDSTAVALAKLPATVLPTVKKDSLLADKPAKDSAPAPVQQAVQPVAKKDSVNAVVHNDTFKDSTKAIKNQAPPLVMVNSDCKEIALDSDIDKLRIKMLLVVSDEDRLALARKLYKQKCLAVRQVKALSELFKSDEGKYKWFDAVYPFVTDAGNFASLAELIKSDYYLNRFKAMIRN